LVPLVLPGALRRRVVDGDFSHQFFPYRFFAAHEWWSGRIPLWNPDMFAGHPFQADVQTAVFYPIALANALLFGWRDFPYLALEGEVVVHTWLAGVFTYLLARRLTGSRLGGLVAGVAFAFGGFLTSYPEQQLPILETAIWLPLIVLALHLATEDRATGYVKWRWIATAGLAFGLALLAGHPQTALFMLYATESYLLFRLIASRTAWRPALAALVAFPAVAALVAAIQLLPSLQLLSLSTREEMDYAAAAHGYLPSALWQVFVPLWHGEKALSIGVVALALAVVGGWASRREPLAYWTVAGLFALPLSVGGATPLFWVLYHVAPGWSLFRDQERAIYVFSFAAALLAGRGVAELWRRADRSVLARLALSISAAAIVALLLFLAGPLLGEPSSLRINLGLDAAVLAALAGVLFLGARRGRLAVPLAATVVALVVAETFALNFGNNLGPDSPDPRPRLAATAAYVRAFPEPFRVATTSESTFPSNYGALLGLPNIGGDTPFELRRMHEVLTPDAGWRLWQILNVKFAIGDPAATDGLKLVFQDNGLKTYFMQDSLPRAWAVRAVEVARDDSEARALILAPGYHPGNVVVLEQAPTIGPFSPGQRPDVKITRLEPQRVAIDVNADGNAMLVLAQQYYPGWQAYRDGQLVTTYQANYVAMAFEIPPGVHRFEIVYRSLPFYLGAALSLMTLLALAFVLVRATRPRLAWPIRPRELVKAGRPRSVTWAEARNQVGLRRVLWWGAALGLTALAFALRLHDLGVPNLTGDEWFMLRNHDEGPLWIIHQARVFEPHPLLYYLSLAGWIELAGRTEFALRLPSVAYGVLVVPALIGLGRALLGSRVGLMAGTLAAINPYQIVESQNARDYAMVAGLSAIASLLFIRAVRRGRRGDWLAYGAAMLLALNAHYDAALVFAAHVAYLVMCYAAPRWRAWRERAHGRLAADSGLFSPLPGGEGGGEGEPVSVAAGRSNPEARRVRSFPLTLTLSPGRGDRTSALTLILSPWERGLGAAARTMAMVAILFAAMVLYALPGLLAYHGYFPNPVGPWQVLARSLATFSLGADSGISRAAPLFVLALVGLGWLAARRPAVAIFLALYALLPVALVSVLFAFRPMFDERYLIVLAPGYLLLLAAGIEVFFRLRIAWPVGIMAAAGALTLTIPALTQTYRDMTTQRADYRGMAAWVSAYGKQEDAIVATGYGQAELFGYYVTGRRATQVLDQPDQIAKSLPTLLGPGRGIWLLPYWENPADLAALDQLNRAAVPIAERWFNGARALYYASPQELSQPSAARGIWDERLALTGVRLTGGAVRPGEAIGAELDWKVGAAEPTPKMSFRLFDGQGNVVVQRDTLRFPTSQVGPGDAVTRTGLFVPLVTAPGTYSMTLLLYRTNGDALPLVTDYPSPDGALTLGQIVVAPRAGAVPPGEVSVGQRDDQAFPSGVTLLGHDPIDGTHTTGDTLTVQLIWQANRAHLPELQRTLELRDPAGRVVGAVNATILPAYPTSSWVAGQIVEERARFQVPPTIGNGPYALTLRVGPGDGPVANLGRVVVAGPDRSFAKPTVAHAVNARFGSFATLLGFDLDHPHVAPGGRVGLTFFWDAAGAADRRYTVFVHLLDSEGKIRGQIDRPPLAGTRPTDGWTAGEYLRDSYDPAIGGDAPVGRYQIEVGLYDPATGARVPVVLADGAAADHVVVGSFEVGP
jgi:hypothetical protein